MCSYLAGSKSRPATEKTGRLGGVRARHEVWYRRVRATVAPEISKQEELCSYVRSHWDVPLNHWLLLCGHHQHNREKVQNTKQDLW